MAYTRKYIESGMSAEYKRGYRNKNRDRLNARARAWRRLNSDRIKEQRKSLYEKHADKNKQYSRDYYWENKEVVLEKQREDYWRHPEKHRAHARKYYQKHRDGMLARATEYRQKHRDRILTSLRLYRQINRDLYARLRSLRRARQLGAEGSFTRQEWRDLCDQYGNRCLACGAEGRMTPDHIVPLSRGGTNWISNIQPLCLLCNMRKHTKTVDYRQPSVSRE